MSVSVAFTAVARQDLLKIRRYIVRDGRPQAARRLAEIIVEACATLSENPERGTVPTELEGLGNFSCRQIVIKKYRIIYQLVGGVVIILGVIDGRRSVCEIMKQRMIV